MGRVNASRDIAVVYNPVKIGREQLSRHLERYLGPEDTLRWAETNVEDPGFAQADKAVEDGADLVIAAGGDGTVRMVALAVSGSETAMGIVPGGTGNLLARNLGIPLSTGAAVRRIFEGDKRLIDLCRAELTFPDGETAHSGFAVMAGVGVDAGMIHYTDEQWKARIGAAAYVPAVFRALGGGNRIDVGMTVDGGPADDASIHTCIVGNCGDIIAGMPLLPDAEVDDGLLDAVVMRPQHVASWGAIGAKLVADSARRTVNLEPARAPHALDYLQGRRLELEFSTPEPLELDGDSAGKVTRAAFEVIPGTLRVVC